MSILFLQGLCRQLAFRLSFILCHHVASFQAPQIIKSPRVHVQRAAIHLQILFDCLSLRNPKCNAAKASETDTVFRDREALFSVVKSPS